jgi:hypothetical protein
VRGQPGSGRHRLRAPLTAAAHAPPPPQAFLEACGLLQPAAPGRTEFLVTEAQPLPEELLTVVQVRRRAARLCGCAGGKGRLGDGEPELAPPARRLLAPLAPAAAAAGGSLRRRCC